MRTTFLVAALALGLSVTGYALAQEGPKNLKVLPKTMTKAEIKKTMKAIADGLGVQCDHCHNTDDMSLDTPKKEKAREMLTMVGEINKKFFKGEMKVRCVTCHNGNPEPKTK